MKNWKEIGINNDFCIGINDQELNVHQIPKRCKYTIKKVIG